MIAILLCLLCACTGQPTAPVAAPPPVATTTPAHPSPTAVAAATSGPVATPSAAWDPATAFPPPPTPLSMAGWSTTAPAALTQPDLGVDDLLALGRQLRESGDLRGAQLTFAEASRVAPDHALASLELARTLVVMRAAGPPAICGMGAMLDAVFAALEAAVKLDPALVPTLAGDPLLSPLAPLYRFRVLQGVDPRTDAGATGLVFYGPPSGVWGSTTKVALGPGGQAAFADLVEQPDGSRSWQYSAGTWQASGGAWLLASPTRSTRLEPTGHGHFSGPEGTWSDSPSECGA